LCGEMNLLQVPFQSGSSTLCLIMMVWGLPSASTVSKACVLNTAINWMTMVHDVTDERQPDYIKDIRENKRLTLQF